MTQPAPAPAEPPPSDLRPEQLSGLFAAPRWLRDLGIMSWLLVGFGVLLVGLVWLLGLLTTIVIPVIIGGVLGAVAGPLVSKLQRRGVPRAGGAALTLLLVVAVAIGILLLVVGGLLSQSDEISAAANKALARIQSGLEDLGITSTDVTSELKKSVPSSGGALISGVFAGISQLASVMTMVVFAVFSTFFFLKDGPSMRAWANRHMGLPEPVARIVTGDTLHALRQYFLGVTIVAAFNAILIGAGALILGVPLAGTIAVVTFVGAYVPFIGAWVAGAFAVALALSTGSTTDAIIMAVIALLANGMLQQVVQPIAFGATLSLNPLVVLIATIGGGCLFGMVGLVLGAPLVSAAANISKHLAAARDRSEQEVVDAVAAAVEEVTTGAPPAPA